VQGGPIEAIPDLIDNGRGVPTPFAPSPLDPGYLARAKAAYTTRFVDELRLGRGGEGFSLLTGDRIEPRSGDVVLVAVGEIGQHQRLELTTGRRSALFPGDQMLLAYGPRYAPDQFEAEVPPDLQPADLVAAGGLIGRMRSSHDEMQDPTQVIPLGLLADAEGVVTLDRCAPLQHSTSSPARWEAVRPSVIAVLGTSMNSGKTTTVASIVRGLTAAGHRVAAGKVTGTGAGGDSHMYADAGATRVLDFTDFGFSSTYQLDAATVTAIFTSLIDELAGDEPDVIVVEIADGLLQPETSDLIVDPWFHDIVGKVVFSAGDAMGAMTGLAELRGRSLDPVAVAGLVTASPLAIRETERVVDVPVVPLVDLCTPEIADRILAPAAHPRELKPVAAG
jgi:hypothetical protein